jgi:hypothetical protein
VNFDLERSPERGLFLAHSGILQVHFPSAEIASAFPMGSTKIAPEHLGARRVDCDSVAFNRMSIRQSEAFLTLIHEREHYARFFSTPFGLLVWRSLNVLSLGVRVTALEVSKFGAPNFQGKSLTDWFATEGQDWLRGRLQSNPEIADTVLKPYSVSFARYLITMNRINERLISVYSFLGELLGETQLTLGELAHSANRAFNHLAFESDIKNLVLWETRYPTLPALPANNSMFTVRDLLESAARMKEYEIIQVSGNREGFGETWKKNHLGGKQGAAFDLVLKVTGNPVVARVVFEVAFSSKIDIACFADSQPERLYIEDVHPSWRFYRLIGLLCDDRVLSKDKRLQLIRRGIDALTEIGPEKVLSMPGLKSSVEVAKDHPIIGPVALRTWVQQLGFINGDDGREIPLSPEMEIGWSTLHFLKSQINTFHRAFDERHSNSIVNQEGMIPDLEFYSDTVKLNNYAPGGNHFWKYLQNMRMLTIHMGCMALLEGGELPSFDSMLRGMKARFERAGMDQTTPAFRMLNRGFLNPEMILRETLGEGVYPNLRFRESRQGHE